MKECKTCGEVKGPEEYTPRPTGLPSIHCKECVRVKDRARWIERKPKVAIYKRLKNYGLTEEAYQSMLIGQDYQCAICFNEEKLYVDHCHTVGHVRGLLCNTCNLLLGHAKDNTVLLESAVKYLRNN